ncbi:MAG: acyl carrier protein [Micrococcaceae bacterium]|nr:acyl carrier protein [Micrococcaceae bacterium]
MQQLGGQWKLQTVIRESAALLGIPAAEITADSDLADLGLDSVRFIQLVMKLKKQGLDVPLERLVQGGPVSGWLKEV